MSEMQAPAGRVHTLIGTLDQDVVADAQEETNNDPFWGVIEAQLHELRSARTADDVLRILEQERNPYGPGTSSAPGFFAGSGGDDAVLDALDEAGWEIVWCRAPYYFCMRAPNGSCITYVEGDIFPGNDRQTENG